MRIIDDETYAQIIKVLAQDPKVALFQKLLLSQKAEPAENQPDEITIENSSPAAMQGFFYCPKLHKK